MCLVLFAYNVSEKYPIVLAANRDEFYSRPTAPMAFWETHPDLLAGKDLERGGTWFGVTRSGRFAALTNFRNPSGMKPSVSSRGEIITEFLTTATSGQRFAAHLEKTAGRYNGYNLLFGDMNGIYWFSNVTREFRCVESGIHGLSNRYLDTPWPKVVSGRKALESSLGDEQLHDTLLSVLEDRVQPGDQLLPNTGVGLEWERILSPLFIESETYGTRSSTVMTIDSSNLVQVTERTFDQGCQNGYNDLRFSLP